MENKTIIFIDRDEFFRKLYKNKFEKKGMEVIQDKGRESLEKIKENKPDLVITDVILNGTDGFSIIEDMKEDEELSDIPVIVFTSLSQETDKKNAEELGVDAYFVKQDVQISEMMNKVTELLSS